MKSQDEVIVLAASRSVAGAVAKALEEDNRLTVTDHFTELSEVASHLSQRPASAVVVDVDPEPLEMLNNLGPVVRRFSGTCFVALSKDWDERVVLEAMEVGVRHLMRKESVGEELSSVLRRLLPRLAPSEVSEGSVVTVLSAGGGCGATTIAVNMANELRLSEGETVLLVDMDISYGAVTAFLNLSGTYGLADVLGQAGPVDVDLVRSSATPCAGGMDVLLSPVAINFASPPEVDYTGLGDILTTFRQAYVYTIIDAPRLASDAAVTLAQASKRVLVVMQLTVKDVRIGQQICSLLTDRGIPADRIVPVVSRYSKKDSSIGLNELKRAIGCNDISLVSNDFPHAIRSIDMGEPLALTAARSTLRKDIQKLADAMVSAES